MEAISFYNDKVLNNAIIFEEWLPVEIEGVDPSKYQVSNFGRVKNIKGQIIKPNKINSGYLTYRFFKERSYRETDTSNNRYISKLAHRLVKETFDPVDNMENLTVNHNNDNKHDNYINNLSWMSQLENNMAKVISKRQYGSNIYNAKLNMDQLKIIKSMLAENYKYYDIVEAIGLEQTPNNRDLIGNIKRGITYQRELSMIR